MIPGWPPAGAPEALHRIDNWRFALKLLKPDAGPRQVLQEIEKWLPKAHPLYGLVVTPPADALGAFARALLDELAKSLRTDGT
jgi:hypothetical protein